LLQRSKLRKIVITVLDGIGDTSIEELHGKTPLEVANTPNLDFLSRNGLNGMIYPVKKGFVPETDTGMLSLWGYDVEKYYIRRAPIEWYGFERTFNNGDLAFRVNFATLYSDNSIDRDIGKQISQSEAKSLVEAINSELKLTSMPVNFKLRDTTTYQAAALLLVKKLSENLSDRISNTDPWYPLDSHTSIPRSPQQQCFYQECKPLDSSLEAERSAILVNEFVTKSHYILQNHKINKIRARKGQQMANLFLTRHAGNKIPKLPSLKRRFGLNFGYITALPLERGLGLLTGIKTINMRNSGTFSLDPGNLSLEYQYLAEDIVKYIKVFDVLFAHVKGPDKAAHHGDFVEKKSVIELIDKFLFGNLLASLDLENTICCITADHATPCKLKLHSDDRVPIVITGENANPDKVEFFNESSCARGTLALRNGIEVLPFLISLARGC